MEHGASHSVQELTAAARRPESARRFAVAAVGVFLAAAAIVTLSSRGEGGDSREDVVLAVRRDSGADQKRAAHARLRRLGRTQMLTPMSLKNRAVAEADFAKQEQFAERIAALPELGGSAQAAAAAAVQSDASKSEVQVSHADARASLQVGWTGRVASKPQPRTFACPLVLSGRCQAR